MPVSFASTIDTNTESSDAENLSPEEITALESQNQEMTVRKMWIILWDVKFFLILCTDSEHNSNPNNFRSPLSNEFLSWIENKRK